VTLILYHVEQILVECKAIVESFLDLLNLLECVMGDQIYAWKQGVVVVVVTMVLLSQNFNAFHELSGVAKRD
jgi:hypothetical protein